jgi:hypothetical protein
MRKRELLWIVFVDPTPRPLRSLWYYRMISCAVWNYNEKKKERAETTRRIRKYEKEIMREREGGRRTWSGLSLSNFDAMWLNRNYLRLL